jgi:hypothetical protein
MNRTLGQNQFARRTRASLEEVPTVGRPVGASYYDVRMHLWLSVVEGDVANERKQFHLFVENAGWIVLFRPPVRPTQLRVGKSADGLKLLPAKPRPLAISSPVSKIRAKGFGSSSICFHRMTPPFPKTISDLQKTGKDLRKLLLQSWIDQREIRFRIKTLLHRYRIDGDHYFQRWRYIRIENMAGTRCSV